MAGEQSATFEDVAVSRKLTYNRLLDKYRNTYWQIWSFIMLLWNVIYHNDIMRMGYAENIEKHHGTYNNL